MSDEDPLLTHEPIVTLISRGPNATQGGEPRWVYAACPRDNSDVGWWCDTHQLYHPKRHRMVEHCREPGEHAIARNCPQHGLEAPEKRA